MEKQEARDLIKALGSLDKTIAAHTKELTQFGRKIDTLNDNVTRLSDKISTYIQIQNNS